MLRESNGDLTDLQMVLIYNEKTWKTLNKKDKNQFMGFMFGKEFMETKKGECCDEK